MCVLVLNYKALFFLSERALTMKYVLVTGGVVSGLGKGVTASSIGVLLKACGLRVTSIKIGMCVCVCVCTYIFNNVLQCIFLWRLYRLLFILIRLSCGLIVCSCWVVF